MKGNPATVICDGCGQMVYEDKMMDWTRADHVFFDGYVEHTPLKRLEDFCPDCWDEMKKALLSRGKSQ